MHIKWIVLCQKCTLLALLCCSISFAMGPNGKRPIGSGIRESERSSVGCALSDSEEVRHLESFLDSIGQGGYKDQMQNELIEIRKNLLCHKAKKLDELIQSAKLDLENNYRILGRAIFRDSREKRIKDLIKIRDITLRSVDLVPSNPKLEDLKEKVKSLIAQVWELNEEAKKGDLNGAFGVQAAFEAKIGQTPAKVFRTLKHSTQLAIGGIQKALGVGGQVLAPGVSLLSIVLCAIDALNGNWAGVTTSGMRLNASQSFGKLAVEISKDGGSRFSRGAHGFYRVRGHLLKEIKNESGALSQ